jgi:hypothetical protein
MNFGQNALTWLQGQLIPVMLIIVIIGALTLAFKRKFTALIGFLIFMGITGAIVASPNTVVELGTKLWNVVFA